MKPHIKLDLPVCGIIGRKEDGNIIAGTFTEDKEKIFPAHPYVIRYSFLNESLDKVGIFEYDLYPDEESDEDDIASFSFYQHLNVADNVTSIFIEVFDPERPQYALARKFIFVYDQESYEKIIEKAPEGVFDLKLDNEDSMWIVLILCMFFGMFDSKKVEKMAKLLGETKDGGE